MTAHDPRSRPTGSPATPRDGATSRTDDGVHPHDADAPDALDAWLESHVVDFEGVPGLNGHANGGPAYRPNSHAPGASTSDTPLVATARDLHRRVAEAEAACATGIPETAIWERIMSSQLIDQGSGSVQTHHASSAPARSRTGAVGIEATRPAPIIDRFTGGHPAVSAVLAAAVILAVIAIFRVIGAPPSNPAGNLATGPDSNANSGFAAASPTGSDAERWIVDPNTATCDLDSANPPGAMDGDWVGFAPLAGPLPFSDTSTTNQTSAAEVYLQFRTCQTDRPDNPAVDLLVSDRFAQFLTAESDDIPPDQRTQNVTLGQQISGTYADGDPMSYVIEGDPLPADASSSGSFAGQSRRVLLPDGIVQLADGRIGGPAHVFFRTNNPSGAPPLLGLPEFLETGFVVFTVEDGRWVIDDYLQLCIGDCDVYWASIAGRYGPSATPDTDATGVATPPASPVASLDDGTLLIDDGSGIVSRPLDGSPGTTLETYGPSGPPTYIRTTVPDVVILSDGKTAQNTRSGEVLGTNPYESAIVIGPFWVQYTSQNVAAPVDARIVDLRTMELVGFFDLAGVDPEGLGPEWVVEGTESGSLSVAIVDRADVTGPPVPATSLLIDGDLARTRTMPLWSPGGINSDVLAFSPDGSRVAYVTGTGDNIVIRVETIAGEPIADIPWPGATPVAHLVLPDARTLLVMSEGQVLRADLTTGSAPAPLAGYPDEFGDVVLSPDGSQLLFATFDPPSDPGGNREMSWHWLDIVTGDMRPIPEATGGHQVSPEPSIRAGLVMLWVPVEPLDNGTYRVLFVDVTTGVVTPGQTTGVTSGVVAGQAIAEGSTVFAAFGTGSPEAPRFRIESPQTSIPLNGQLAVFDAGSRSVVEIPFPDIPLGVIDPAIFISPDGHQVVLSVRWTDDGGAHAQSWITTTDGKGVWTPIEGGLVIGWAGA